MLKVMLVDDEALIIEGLKYIIEWDKLGLEVVNTASSGDEALKKFKENPVDIVVTDINMPKVTGLELLSGLKNINDNVKFIVLSGYDEFSYAKKAMELGVKSYLLKPVNEDELEKCLKKIVDDIDNGKTKDNNLVAKNSKVIDFLNSKIDISEIVKLKDIMRISLDNEKYIVANIVFKGYKADEVIACIKNNIIGSLEVVQNYDGSIILINSLDKDISEEGLIEFYNIIKDIISEDLDIDVFISVGSEVSKIEDIRVSYKNSLRAKKQLLVEGYGKVIFSGDAEKEVHESISYNNEISELNKIIIEKNTDKATVYLLDLIQDEKLTPKNIYDLSIKVIILVDEISREFNIQSKYSTESFSSVIVDLCNEDSRENIERFLLAEIDELIKFISDNNKVFSPIVQQVVKVINDEYKDELSLKTLSVKYRINSSYLGQIFSKEVGISFSEYLNKVKNTKAKELILNTNMRINNIAREVGYTDTSYFYRKFKKYYGVCPSTLREMKNY